MSLELNLFFGRIMKEHMIVMQTRFLIKDSNYILEAENLKKSFEEILSETVKLSNGVISQEAIDSNEFVTQYTLDAEKKVEFLSGVCINKDITKNEMKLTSDPDFKYSASLEEYVFDLNNRIINLITDLIKFKENILAQILDCNVFMAMYSEMLKHLLREAKFYLKLLLDLQERVMSKKNILEKEIFWNDIMGEHAQFVRGYLDPTERELMKKAHNLAKTFEKLRDKTKEADKKEACEITEKNLEATEEIKQFNTDATTGLLNCEIRAIMTPLLGDHVLREANRYIRIMEKYLKEC